MNRRYATGESWSICRRHQRYETITDARNARIKSAPRQQCESSWWYFAAAMRSQNNFPDGSVELHTASAWWQISSDRLDKTVSQHSFMFLFHIFRLQSPQASFLPSGRRRDADSSKTRLSRCVWIKLYWIKLEKKRKKKCVPTCSTTDIDG